MNTECLNDKNSLCTNSKINIKADNYSKTKIFNVENAVDQRLSRVDSSNYPDTANDLDNLAQKMGFNQQNNNVSSCKAVTLTKLDRCSEERINEKGLSKSFQVSTDKPLVSTPNKLPHRKSGFMSSIISRLSISTPKMFSKNKKIRKSKRNLDDDSSVEHKVENLKTNESNLSNNGEKIVNGVSDKNSPISPKSKSIKRFLQKLGKKKEKGKVTSEPPSSVESRPSLSSVVNHGLNYETTTSCNDIFLNKVCKDDFQKYNCSSADCILDYPKNIKSNKQHESVSSTSEDLIEHEAKLNAVINVIPNDQLAEFPGVEESILSNDQDNLSPLSIKTNDFKFETQRSCHSTMSGSYHAENSNNVKLTLALYGYTNYGLSSSRLASKSCMEFRSATINKKMKLSMDNVSIDKVARISKTIDYREKNHHDSKKDEEPIKVTVESTKTNEVIEQDVTVRQDDSSRNSESTVVLRKSQRPNDIKLRKSREPSQNLVARSSMIMLVVSHNSPRSKIISNQLSTPNKEIDLNNSLNGNNQQFSNIPAMKLNFDNFSIKDRKSESDDTNENEKKPISADASVDNNNINSIENGFDENKTEIIDGKYFLNLVHKHETDILKKIDIVQSYLDSENPKYEDDVSGQLLVTIGKAKLLLSEKMVQFKGLCEKNISGIIEENELPTLLSDLNGFWDMVYGQIEDINKNFILVEKIRQNDWKMIPYEIKEKSSLNTPGRSKRSTGSTRPSIGQTKNTPILTKKKPASESVQQSIAEKRKNMMKFKMNQKSSISQQNADPNFSTDITFY